MTPLTRPRDHSLSLFFLRTPVTKGHLNNLDVTGKGRNIVASLTTRMEKLYPRTRMGPSTFLEISSPAAKGALVPSHISLTLSVPLHGTNPTMHTAPNFCVPDYMPMCIQLFGMVYSFQDQKTTRAGRGKLEASVVLREPVKTELLRTLGN